LLEGAAGVFLPRLLRGVHSFSWEVFRKLELR
jgi:hypothetical protein